MRRNHALLTLRYSATGTLMSRHTSFFQSSLRRSAFLYRKFLFSSFRVVMFFIYHLLDCVPLLLSFLVKSFHILFSYNTFIKHLFVVIILGIGYAIIVVLLLVNTYYNVLIAYALFYLFASITSELPWGKCDNKWNTKYCIATKYGTF